MGMDVGGFGWDKARDGTVTTADWNQCIGGQSGLADMPRERATKRLIPADAATIAQRRQIKPPMLHPVLIRSGSLIDRAGTTRWTETGWWTQWWAARRKSGPPRESLQVYRVLVMKHCQITAQRTMHPTNTSKPASSCAMGLKIYRSSHEKLCDSSIEHCQ